MNHIEDLLWDWLNGDVSDAESETISAHLETCADCQAALDVQTALLAQVALEMAPTISSAREQVLAAATSSRRFERFVDEIARLTDVALDQAKAWVKVMDDATSFTDTAFDFMTLFHIDGGQKVENAIVGFVKIKGGESFPEHTHLGLEQMYVLQGKFRDSVTGNVYGPGELLENPTGTTHDFSAEPGVDLIYLNVTQVGIELFGMTFGPESPDL